MNFSLEVDWAAAAIVTVFCLIWWIVHQWKERQQSPALLYPSLSLFAVIPGLGLARWSQLPQRLECIALFFLLIALINPRLFVEKPHEPFPPIHESVHTQGIAIYLVLDQSGSMGEPTIISSMGRGREKVTKLDLLKRVTKAFIQGDSQFGFSGRPSDMMGIVAFARSAQVLSPLTLDHRELVDQLDKLDIMRTQDQDGTAIGYAIFKTVNLIAATRHYAELQKGEKPPSYTIKNSVMILVTDGLQDPNPLDLNNRWRGLDPEEAAAYAKKNHVRLYIVNVDPSLNKTEFQPSLNQMRRVAETTGGKFFMVDQNGDLGEIYREIDRLEKSDLSIHQDLLKDLQKQLSKEELPALYQMVSFYPYLIGLAMISILIAQILKTSWLRSIP